MRHIYENASQRGERFKRHAVHGPAGETAVIKSNHHLKIWKELLGAIM